jgi:hypothetical protein
MSAEDIFDKLVQELPPKELNLEGFTTIRQPRKVVALLRQRGIDVETTVENFLDELLERVKKNKIKPKPHKEEADSP